MRVRDVSDEGVEWYAFTTLLDVMGWMMDTKETHDVSRVLIRWGQNGRQMPKNCLPKGYSKKINVVWFFV